MSKNRKSDIEYRPQEIEPRWQRYWEENGIFSPDLKNAKKPFDSAQGKPFYNLMMFPYPSAEGLHVGNMYAFTGADVYGRYQRMRGNDVFEPIGLDGFGIHSENYALKVGRHPAKQAEISEKNFYRQLRATGNAYDWTRALETYDPAYYRWTQWIFVQMFKKGLAYRKKAQVNWCPSCKTVLADEQVIQKSVSASSPLALENSSPHPPPGGFGSSNIQASRESKSPPLSEERIGVCERCETAVEKRELEQWFFRITEYADRLLSGLDKIDWPEKIKVAQRQWIGRSEGARIHFNVILNESEGSKNGPGSTKDSSAPPQNDIPPRIEVFTTRQDTLFGATFMVISPEHPIVASLLNSIPIKSGQNSKLGEIRKYVKRAKSRSDKERIEGAKEKTGVFSGLYAINPANNEKIPVWIADYVLMGYGTGAIMAVPAHDSRDFEFAKKYDLPIRQVIVPDEDYGPLRSEARKPLKKLKEAYDGPGRLVNSGDWDDYAVPEVMPKIIGWLEEKGAGKKETTYHLRDWLISRQRYWGPPIPMVFCEKCAREGKSWFTSSEYSESSENQKTSESQKVGLSDLSDTLENRSSQYSEFSGMAGWYPVSEEDLPVLLPDVEDWRPKGEGVSPLANHPEFYETKCPSCSHPARRETDVSDTFLDSSWYYLRYLSIGNKKNQDKESKDIKNNQGSIVNGQLSNVPYDINIIRKWCPVAIYIGGAEHAVLHLLYVRFVAMVLHDLKNDPSTRFDSAQRRHSVRSGWNVSALALPFQEPFPRFYAHGLLIKDAAKMSKSRGNVIVPDEYIKKFGADTLRLYLMFLGPFDQGGDFRDTGIEGMSRFVRRVWKLLAKQLTTNNGQPASRQGGLTMERLRMMHKTIKAVTQDIEQFSYNTAIARMMEWYNFLWEQVTSNKSQVTSKEAETFLKLLAPFAPHFTEELWQTVYSLQSTTVVSRQKAISIHFQEWPKYDENYLVEEEVIIVVQVNGKRRGGVIVSSSNINKKEKIEALARKEVEKYIEGKNVQNVVYVPGRIINFVI